MREKRGKHNWIDTQESYSHVVLGCLDSRWRGIVNLGSEGLGTHARG
jgi:hypothetical protein